MKLPTLLVEERDLGGGFVEGYFELHQIAGFLALQTGLPYETIEARIIESYGYWFRPPKDDRKVLIVCGAFDEIDRQTIKAMRLVVESIVDEARIERIKKSFRASTFGDPFWIGWDLSTHPYVVQAVLENLEERGELPERDLDGC